MKPNKVIYVVKAIHQWCTDSNLTPHILVDTKVKSKDFDIPDHIKHYIYKDGSIVFNISNDAIGYLSFGHNNTQRLTFTARFNGGAATIIIPYNAIVCIYAKETGEGVYLKGFEDNQVPEKEDTPPPKGHHLRVVK